MAAQILMMAFHTADALTNNNQQQPARTCGHNQRTITMKCVIITYQSGKTAVYLKSDPALLDEILHSNDWIVELQESEFVQPQLIETKGGE